MKFLTKLEKSKSFWYLIIISVIFFLLRFPSFIEPYWYGDEGIYEVIGQAIDNGRLLYTQAWDNKPPLLYLVYAFFHDDQNSIRFFSFIVGLLSVLCFFYLSQKIFKKLGSSVIASSLYAILFALPIIEGNIANAENFMLLPIITAGYLIYQNSYTPNTPKKRFLIPTAGLLLGIAFLFKIVALFDFAAFFLYFVIVQIPKQLHKRVFSRSFVFHSIALIVSFFIPILVTALYFFSQNALSDFIQAVFFGNINYVGYKNTFIIPQGLLILKVLILSGIVLFLFIRRKKFSHASLFILLWTSFALFNTFFSGRPYNHYLLVLLPSFCLLIGYVFAIQTYRKKLAIGTIIVIILIIITQNFNVYGFKKTMLYYQNTVLFLLNKKDLTAYRSFFDKKVPRDYELASFIKAHTNSSENIFIWGNNPQIYALSHKLPPGKYTVAYHMTQNNTTLNQTQRSLQITKPRYIIILAEAPGFPFPLSTYKIKYMIKDTTIYEKSF
jgi:hypothetical protein